MPASVSHLRAISYAIAGFTCWVLCDSVIKFAGKSQMPNYEIVAFLGIFIAFFISIYAWSQGEISELWPKRPKRLVVRSLLDLINNLCVVVAVRHLPLTLFYIVVFTSPMLVALLGRVFLKESLDWQKSAAIFTGFLGVVIAVYPSRASGNGEFIGFAACAVSATSFSIAIVWSRVIAQAEKAESMTFFSGIVSGACGMVAMAVHAAPVAPRLLASLFVMGLLGAVGNICVFFALKHTSAATVSQYHYSQLVAGTIVAYFVFHESTTVWMFAGAALIVGAGIYIALRKGTPGRVPIG